MENEKLSYIAGFFDGEGSAAIRQVKASKNGKRYPRVEARISQNDRSVLDWIVEELGLGKVHFSSMSSAGNANFSLNAYYKQGRKFLTLIEPFLIVKKQKVSDILNLVGRE